MAESLKPGSTARWAAFISMGIGVGLMVLGSWIIVAQLNHSMPMAVAFVILGSVECVTAWFTLKVVRAAWAFGCSINGTMAFVMLFGAPKVRDSAEVFIGIALAPCVVFGIVTLLYGLGSDDF